MALQYKIMFFLIYLSIPSFAFAQSWPVGVEREVDQGTYMSVYASQNGWRIWRIETKDGVKCEAVKSTKGRPHPVPLGVGSSLCGGTPFLSIRQESRFGGQSYRLIHVWGAKHLNKVKVKIRKIGQKFWDEYDSSIVDMDLYAEQMIQVSVSSWEYPAIYVGFAEENANFDLNGIEAAKNMIKTCSSQD